MADQLRPRTPPPALASNAQQSDGRPVCALCGRPIGAGAREAQLADGGWCHINPCLLATLGGRP